MNTTIMATVAPWLPEGTFEERSRTGELYLSVARDIGGPFPAIEGCWCRDWTSGRFTQERNGSRIVEKWVGYQLPFAGITGEFDVEIEYTYARGRCELRAYLRNRMNIGVCELRHVLRFSPGATPNPERTYVLFGMDEWVQDPIQRLASKRVNRKLATAPTGFVDEGSGYGLYLNRCSPRPMISIHTERFGLMVHDLDPDNAASGFLMVGANNGAVEFGYAYRAPSEHKPGNEQHGRRFAIGPGIRLQRLPENADVDSAWWDALHAFKEYALRTALLPRKMLKQRNVPAEWARDSLSLVVNVGTPVAGDPKHVINPGPAVDIIRSMARFYRKQGQRHFTPMIWGWSAVGPYRITPGFEELLLKLHDVERELDVEIHPAVYMHGCMLSTAVIGTPLEACLMRDLRGKPFTWGGDLYNAHADHPLFINEIERTVKEMVQRGVRGFYFDAPFGEGMPDYAGKGVVRDHHVAIRRMLQRVENLVSRLGGGVISHEAQRLGLPGLKGAAAPSVPGSRIIPFTEALYHEREVPIFFGDLAGQTYSIASADQRYGTLGDYQSDDDIVRMAIEGAVYGRSAVLCNGIDRPYYEMDKSDKWMEQAMYRMAGVAMPNALQARREHRELRTGILLPNPKHDAGQHTVRNRPWVYVNTPQGVTLELQAETIDFQVPLIPVAFYQDAETSNRYLLVAGNTSSKAVELQFSIRKSDLPNLKGSLAQVRIDGARVLSRTPHMISIEVTLKPTDLTCVRLEA
ncbi:MAG: hypothetical protein ACYC1M_14835 [Armatimonadota bacterium]